MGSILTLPSKLPALSDLTYCAKSDGSGWFVDSKISFSSLKNFCTSSSTTEKTSEYIIPSNDCDGRWFSNYGTSGYVVYILPKAIEGMEVSFVCEGNLYWLEARPDPDDAIMPIGGNPGISVFGRNIGSTITLRAMNYGWHIVEKFGSWMNIGSSSSSSSSSSLSSSSSSSSCSCSCSSSSSSSCSCSSSSSSSCSSSSCSCSSSSSSSSSCSCSCSSSSSSSCSSSSYSSSSYSSSSSSYSSSSSSLSSSCSSSSSSSCSSSSISSSCSCSSSSSSSCSCSSSSSSSSSSCSSSSSSSSSSSCSSSSSMDNYFLSHFDQMTAYWNMDEIKGSRLDIRNNTDTLIEIASSSSSLSSSCSSSSCSSSSSKNPALSSSSCSCSSSSCSSSSSVSSSSSSNAAFDAQYEYMTAYWNFDESTGTRSDNLNNNDLSEISS